MNYFVFKTTQYGGHDMNQELVGVFSTREDAVKAVENEFNALKESEGIDESNEYLVMEDDHGSFFYYNEDCEDDSYIFGVECGIFAK